MGENGLPRLSASKIAEKQSQRVGSAAQAYKDGVAAPRRDPIKAALDALPLMQQNWQKSFAEGRIQKNLQKVSQAAWTQAAQAKGDQFATNAAAAQPKVADFWNKWGAQLDAAQQAVNAIAPTSDAAKQQRMITNMQELKKRKGAWK